MSEEGGSPSTSPDLQEALSIRYGVGLRLALLSSGNWALWRGGELRIVPAGEMDLSRLTLTAELERLEREKGRKEYERRQEAGWEQPVVVKAGKSLEDMGL